MWTWLSTLAADAAHALRQLRRNPGFAAAAVLSLGLGIAGNATVFSLVDAMWLRTLPVRQAGSPGPGSPLRPRGRPHGAARPRDDPPVPGGPPPAGLAPHHPHAP